MKPVVIGLTGSIGMGKTTTAAMFADLGIPVWNADDVVHQLYKKNGPAVQLIAEIAPNAVVDGTVDRAALGKWIETTPGGLSQIEAIIHPLVAKDRLQFLASIDADLVVLDIPLLFETRADAVVDYIVVVSASAEEQSRRVMARPGMTRERFDMILSKQLSDEQKRKRADFVVETTSLEAAREAVHNIVEQIKRPKKNA